jgi:hypothetical protein
MAVNWMFATRHLYTKIWWLDNTLHIAGGFFIAAFYRAFISKKSFSLFCAFLVVVVGIWEVLEFFLNGPFFGAEEARLSNPIWVLDTIKDMLVGIVSSILWWKAASLYNKANA